DGTGWMSGDAKLAWHPGGLAAKNVVTAGVHADRYVLENPTYNTADWRTGPFGSVATECDGKTRTAALWVQDSWTPSPRVRLVAGGRCEWWRASEGFNANGTTTVTQPVVNASRFSPKAALTWTPTATWQTTLSVAKAYRFATTAELYQLVSTG